MDMINLDRIKQRLHKELPGWEAQKQMSPIKGAKYREVTPHAKKAAVMLLIHPNKDGEWSLFYIKRTNHNPEDKHGGQISFPGGQVDSTDADYTATALRETYEEIGINKEDIQVLGHLTPLYVFASNFFVQPVVGFLPYYPELTLQASEVQYVIESRLEILQNKETINYMDFTLHGFKAKNMPYYNLEGEVLWGATAMMTSEFLTVLQTLD